MRKPNEGSFVPDSEKSKSLEVLNIPEVRISSASFVRIKDEKNRYALLVNKNKAKKNIVVLTPIGGAVEATPTGIEKLKKLLEIDDSAFEEGNDLRFRMSGKKANEYKKWFLSGEQRESDPSREIFEELVDEAKLIDMEDLEELQCNRAGYATELAQTTRTGLEGQITLRLFEIFDTEIKPATLQKLVDLSQNSNSLIRFVTEDEIRNGKTEDGTEIVTATQSLLDTDKTIPDFE